MPLDLNTITSLKRCALGLDLLPVARLPHLLDPRSAAALLAADLPPVRFAPGQSPTIKTPFKPSVTRFSANLKKIKLAWPGLNYATAPGVLILHPSTPAIPPSPEPLRLVE